MVILLAELGEINREAGLGARKIEIKSFLFGIYHMISLICEIK